MNVTAYLGRRGDRRTGLRRLRELTAGKSIQAPTIVATSAPSPARRPCAGSLPRKSGVWPVAEAHPSWGVRDSGAYLRRDGLRRPASGCGHSRAVPWACASRPPRAGHCPACQVAVPQSNRRWTSDMGRFGCAATSGSPPWFRLGTTASGFSWPSRRPTARPLSPSWLRSSTPQGVYSVSASTCRKASNSTPTTVLSTGPRGQTMLALHRPHVWSWRSLPLYQLAQRAQVRPRLSQ